MSDNNMMTLEKDNNMLKSLNIRFGKTTLDIDLPYEAIAATIT